MEMQIIGCVHVDVDGATYSTAARAAAEDYARQTGLKFSYGKVGACPELEQADNFQMLSISMTAGLPSWCYAVWLVG